MFEIIPLFLSLSPLFLSLSPLFLSLKHMYPSSHDQLQIVDRRGTSLFFSRPNIVNDQRYHIYEEDTD